MLLSKAAYDDAIVRAYGDVASIMAEVFSDRELRGIVRWAEECYQLPPDSAIQGLFRFARAPYLRRPLECLVDPRVKQVVVCKGSQLYFTTLAQIWKGWTMDEDPASMISVWPSDYLVKRYVMTRINRMIEECEPLQRLFTRTGLRSSDDSLKYKAFPGGSLAFLTGKSSGQLKSITAQRMHVSELDELDPDVKGQGDPLDQARRAMRTHPNSTEYLECTPTIADRSRVWKELGYSTWNEFHVPCPQCNHAQVLRWRDGQENGDNEGAGAYRFIYELDSAGRVVPDSTRYVCVACSTKIEHSWKQRMVTAGDWVPRYPDRVQFEGFHLSSLYSLAQSYDWDYCAQAWVSGLRDPAKRKVCVQTILALPYEEKAITTDANSLRARAEEYGVEIPDGVVLITIYVDVQGDRVEYLVVGFGAGLEWWLIEWGRVEGDPAKDDTWDDLGDVLNRDWVDADGVCYGASAIGIDAGFMSTHVKRFCARFTTKDGVRPIHVIGRGGRARPLMEKPGADVKKRRRSKRPSWIMGTDTMNDLVFAKLRVELPGPDFFHTPSDPGRLDPAFYDQVLSEQLETVRVNGLPVRKYILPPDRRNECLDMLRGCYGALVSMGQAVMLKLERLQRKQRRTAAAIAATPPDLKAEVNERTTQQRRVVRPRQRPRAGVVSEAIE